MSKQTDTTKLMKEFTIDEAKGDGRLIPHKVETPKEGGIKSYYGGEEYPYPGYRNRETSKLVEITKRTLKIRFKEILKNPFNFMFGKIKKKIGKWINFASWALRDSRLKPKFYSRPVREIYNAFTKLIERENSLNMKDKMRGVRDVVCTILEFDQAYRFRAQDILSEIDPEKMKMDKADEHYAKKTNYKNYKKSHDKNKK